MPHLPPEILYEIFCLLKATAKHPDLDILAASLVCTHWYMQAWPMVDPALFRVSYLTLKSDLNNYRFIRFCSLLAESVRCRLTYCDHVNGIKISQIDRNNKLRACAAAIHQVVRLQPSHLHHIFIDSCESFERPAAIIELMDVIFPPDEVFRITRFGTRGVGEMGQDITVHLLERLGPTLRDVSLRDFQVNATLLEALGQCHGLECLSAVIGSLPGPDAPAAPLGAVAILAAALPKLTSLTFSMKNWDSEACVSAEQLREIVTRLPGLTHLAVDVDFTVDDKCLRFVMRHAKKMEVFELVGCTMLRGKGVWSKNDVGWRGLRELRLRGTVGMSSSFTRVLKKECPGLFVTISA